MSDERTSAPYDYHYNDMGFRGEDIKRYIGKEVELCIGDSILFNLGDSVENSWPNQLNNMRTLPTLNMGTCMAGNDYLSYIMETADTLFDVSAVYVEFTFLHRYERDGTFYADSLDDLDNLNRLQMAFDVFERFDNFYFTFLPFINYTDVEREYLIPYINKPNFVSYKLCPNIERYLYRNYRDVVDSNRSLYTCETRYNNLFGRSWPSYDEFINGNDTHPDMFLDNFGEFVIGVDCNSDMMHNASHINLEIANNFNNASIT